jgi:D-beta-D-heptose 7-phosphate kinase/D-beta-D-heptose 1-phosphate adenosyltransferase
MKNESLGYMDNFHNVSIVVFGDVMLDEYRYGKVNRLSPEFKTAPVYEEKFVHQYPGGAANAANNLASLGVKVMLTGVVGSDATSKILYNCLKTAGIRFYSIVDKTRPTTTKIRFVGNYWDGRREQIMRYDKEVRKEIDEKIENKAIKTGKKLIKSDSVKAAIFCDYNKGFLTHKLCEEMIGFCKESQKITLVDPKCNFSKYKGATIVTPNEREFVEFSGLSKDYTDSDVFAVMKKNDFKAILITKGRRGMTLYEDGHEPYNINAIQIKTGIEDVSGAGDTVVATLSTALSCGANFREAAELANVAAGIVVGKQDTATTSVDELKGFWGELHGENPDIK